MSGRRVSLSKGRQCSFSVVSRGLTEAIRQVPGSSSVSKAEVQPPFSTWEISFRGLLFLYVEGGGRGGGRS